jgi:hypothetical protein
MGRFRHDHNMAAGSVLSFAGHRVVGLGPSGRNMHEVMVNIGKGPCEAMVGLAKTKATTVTGASQWIELRFFIVRCSLTV